MKMKETLTAEEKNDMFFKSVAVGIFKDLLTATDAYYRFAHAMCLSYYTVRSANKTVSPIYEQILEFVKESGTVPESEYISTTNRLLATKIIRIKFIDKWNRVYDALSTKQYDVFKDFEHTETKNVIGSDTTVYDINNGRTGTNSDTTTYDTNTEDNGKTGTKETTTTNRENSADVYGFNSASPVGDNAEAENATETVVGNADDNTSHNIQTKTGTEKKDYTVNENVTKSGSDRKSISNDENVTKSGRNTTGAELIEAELNLRNTQIFFDIVFRDIDSVATIPIYI